MVIAGTAIYRQNLTTKARKVRKKLDLHLCSPDFGDFYISEKVEICEYFLVVFISLFNTNNFEKNKFLVGEIVDLQINPKHRGIPANSQPFPNHQAFYKFNRILFPSK